MADDGSGADITIPSFLLFKEDADILKGRLRNNQQVRMEMSFSVPAPDDRVEYDLWTTPGDPISKPFLKDFDIAVEALSEHAFFILSRLRNLFRVAFRTRILCPLCSIVQ